jgi:osmotically-inducible protein OsmY
MAVAGTSSFAPCTRAQINTPAETRSGAMLKDETNDRALTAKAQAALARDKGTSGPAEVIHVQTNGGVVTLTGDVAAQAIAEHVQGVVAQLSGVRDVVNDLKYPHAAGSMDSYPIVVPPAAASSSPPPKVQ